MADPTPLPADRLGEGPPVLLLPSGLWDRRMWEPMLPWLTAGFEVLSLDLSYAPPFSSVWDVLLVAADRLHRDLRAG